MWSVAWLPNIQFLEIEEIKQAFRNEFEDLSIDLREYLDFVRLFYQVQQQGLIWQPFEEFW